MSNLEQSLTDKISQECADFFEVEKTSLPKITFLYSRDEVDKAFGRKTEDWIMAGKLKDGLYFIHPSKIDEISSHKQVEFWSAVKHEFSHVYYDKITGVCTPRWFNEGIANIVAGVDVPKPAPIDKQVTDFYFSYSDLETLRWGYAMVNYVYLKYGHDKLIELIKSLSKEPMTKKFFADRFLDVYGFELSELQTKIETK